MPSGHLGGDRGAWKRGFIAVQNGVGEGDSLNSLSFLEALANEADPERTPVAV
jgi:hypothetical protein